MSIVAFRDESGYGWELGSNKWEMQAIEEYGYPIRESRRYAGPLKTVEDVKKLERISVQGLAI